MEMLFKILRPFTADGERLERDAVVELTPTRKTQQLVDQRYLLPTDPEAAEATTSIQNELTNEIVKRRGRPARINKDD